MVILGGIQSVIGTVKLYNESEQTYQKLSPKKSYNTENKAPDLTEKVDKEI